ncbi:MAG: hypothetical protein L3J71_06530 [Victivallaceae bacterium]|nr:hypothetical protein [Victivallaceae bacterium]
MITVGKYKIWFGDFHGQWNASVEELALLPAGLTYHGYDFSAFQTPEIFQELQKIIDDNRIDYKLFPGRECFYEWGHLTTTRLTAEIPAADSQNIEKVLEWFQNHTDWTILAHPYEFMIERMEELIDKKLLNAIELINGFIDTDRHLVKWYYEMQAKGKKIPIVSGLDIHTAHGSRRPSVLYNSNYKPEADIKLFRSNRTGVICELCDVDNIKNAISSCRTFIEIVDENKLIGPPEIVEYLEANGYWEAVTADLEQRRALATDSNLLLVGGQYEQFRWQHPIDEIHIAGEHIECSTDKLTHQVNIPLKFDKNIHYINMVSHKEGQQTVNALKIYHPLSVELIVADGSYRTVANITNMSNIELTDIVFEINCNGQTFHQSVPPLGVNRTTAITNHWKIAEPLRPTLFTATVTTPHISKTIEKYLVFVQCSYIDDVNNSAAWEQLPFIKMGGDFAEQVDHAFTLYWNGDDDLSAQIRMAWNENGLYFKLNIKDDVLMKSKTKLLMFGDSFQIGINPVGTDAVGNQSFYDIMMTRGTEEDEEKAYMERPVNMALEAPINQRTPLKGLYTGKVTEDGFEGLLTLPFHLLTPMQPTSGYRFGLYLIIFDNDGAGLKTSLQWPLSAVDILNQAWYIPYGGAWANIELG